ncbi:hypothetical protein MPSEU_000394800 [Mayamaea pseudoterrestris]|nr:hypothetical protein MPSEU_000394800 [Mayamaea pseudoterrestris]
MARAIPIQAGLASSVSLFQIYHGSARRGTMFYNPLWSRVIDMILWYMILTLLVCVHFACASSNEAYRDSNYYAANRINPNVRNKQYYAESSNVLQSLANFDKLYVSYHNCVWSTYDHEGEGDTCGVETDDAYWYMGSTECFRANAAYSLYGVLKGQKDTGCSPENFVNSFFTTSGVEAFTQSVVNSGKISFSSNSRYTNDDDGEEDLPGGISSTCYENGGNNRDLGDNYGSVNHNTKYNSGQTSYGLACNGKKFAIKTFKGSYCDHTASQKTSDSLSTFNSEMHQAQCVPIYSSSSYKQNKDNSPLNVLYNSRSCSIREYPGLCPDPFSKLKQYAAAEERAVARTYSTKQSRTIRAIAILLIVLGVLLVALSTLIYLRRSRLSRLRAMRKRLMLRRRKHKDNKDKLGWFASDKSNRTKGTTSNAGVDTPNEDAAAGRKSKIFGRKSSKV